ncbi:MAG: N-6 DNA methylase [Candidatus Promineifilaceae bacterium]|nr:N-6 DNA methylase [Candidatus Promineifilaceae bacterium]
MTEPLSRDKQRTYGQFETPVDVADLILAFCLRHPNDRLLDPSCGTGAFLARAARLQRWLAGGELPPGRLWGVELDPSAAQQAAATLPQAHIITGDFFTLEPWSAQPFDAVVGNPPYVRAEWFEQLQAQAQQLAIFDDRQQQDEEESGVASNPARSRTTHQIQAAALGRRAGLHAYFFVHSTAFLRQGGRLGFVVSNSWLDVAYGQRLKQYLLEHYKILALIESNVERWFSQAKVNTCVIVLERCEINEQRRSNRVRLVQLRRPLAELIPYEVGTRERLSHLERLSARLLPASDGASSDLSVRVVEQTALSASERWGVALRAPAVQRRGTRQTPARPLADWLTVKRGHTSGANAFFYLDRETAAEWAIEAQFLRPLLKSLRSVNGRQVGAQDCAFQLLSIDSSDDLTGTAAEAYVRHGEAQGLHRRRTCANRTTWYRLPPLARPDLLLAKGVWARHFAPQLMESLQFDQQLYGLYLHEGVDALTAVALLNSAWFALQLELHGRVNLGEGVLWLAAYELAAIRLPDPRYLPDSQVAALQEAATVLLGERVMVLDQAESSPAWHSLNEVMTEVMGFSAADGEAVTAALLERVRARQAKAGQISR